MCKNTFGQKDTQKNSFKWLHRDGAEKWDVNIKGKI